MTSTADPTPDPSSSGAPTERSDDPSLDQTLEDAEGGVEGSTLDAPED